MKLQDALGLYYNGSPVLRVMFNGEQVWAPIAQAGRFGKETPGAETFPTSDGRIFIGRYTLPVGARIRRLSAHFSSVTSGNIRAVVYADTGEAASDLLHVGAPSEGLPDSDGWLSSAFLPGAALPSGAYWIGFVSFGLYGTVTLDSSGGDGWDYAGNSDWYDAPVQHWPYPDPWEPSGALAVFVEYD